MVGLRSGKRRRGKSTESLAPLLPMTRKNLRVVYGLALDTVRKSVRMSSSRGAVLYSRFPEHLSTERDSFLESFAHLFRIIERFPVCFPGFSVIHAIIGTVKRPARIISFSCRIFQLSFLPQKVTETLTLF